MDYKSAKNRREKVQSRTIILKQDGFEKPLENYNLDSEKDSQLKVFLKRESGAEIENIEAPQHIKIMQQQELIDYEPSSDIGHFRFYPKGTLMKNLIEDLAEDIAINKLGAIKIETPLLYRAETPDIAEQAASFHERDYRVKLEDRELLLRFAGDFGLFSMMKDAKLTYKNLPLRVYEISNSFRFEQSGELSGLKRLRAFTMPDIHCFCKNFESGLEEYAKLHKFYDHLLHETELPFALAFRTVEDFWSQNKKFILDRLKESKKDGLVEILKDMKHYWNLKNEFQYIDNNEDNVQLSTVQLDISDSKRYGLGYVDSDNQKKPMVIVHSSMGSVERILSAIFEERAREMKRGQKPTFPYWLSPTQLRLIPVNPTFIRYCENILSEFKGIRVDIDDRDESVGKKVRSAEKEWIPAYAVIGEIESASNLYNLKLRGKEFSNCLGEKLTTTEINKLLLNAQGEKPYRDSYLNKKVSKKIRFGSLY
ncbi:MAG: His/Gly/Thr/Pro-type tRNA ligase C-terminal domain-containing protein [Candidatus Nanoarchaeia archaeon]|nr:His/Gly/Thr/Pro-type tRNA ligase C-terminal domain-containing protein [Candidatus Nanoarchaeia archaeon]MDD5588425.1 His/Gly/Thr/Pro-type tRNA ligase C-terminal domain-containing protein [Candidatus Nanoarchaeia archaeon]